MPLPWPPALTSTSAEAPLLTILQIAVVTVTFWSLAQGLAESLQAEAALHLKISLNMEMFEGLCLAIVCWLGAAAWLGARANNF